MTDLPAIISFMDAVLAEADCEQKHGIQLCDALREVRRHLESCPVSGATIEDKHKESELPQTQHSTDRDDWERVRVFLHMLLAIANSNEPMSRNALRGWLTQAIAVTDSKLGQPSMGKKP